MFLTEFRAIDRHIGELIYDLRRELPFGKIKRGRDLIFKIRQTRNDYGFRRESTDASYKLHGVSYMISLFGLPSCKFIMDELRKIAVQINEMKDEDEKSFLLHQIHPYLADMTILAKHIHYTPSKNTGRYTPCSYSMDERAWRLASNRDVGFMFRLRPSWSYIHMHASRLSCMDTFAGINFLPLLSFYGMHRVPYIFAYQKIKTKTDQKDNPIMYLICPAEYVSIFGLWRPSSNSLYVSKSFDGPSGWNIVFFMAAGVIQKAWLSYRYKKILQMLRELTYLPIGMIDIVSTYVSSLPYCRYYLRSKREPLTQVTSADVTVT